MEGGFGNRRFVRTKGGGEVSQKVILQNKGGEKGSITPTKTDDILCEQPNYNSIFFSECFH